jgi:hypothetical protein
VPQSKKSEILKSLEKYCEGKLRDGKIERKLNIFTAAGKKP